jgi:hypothetical protein
LEKIRIWKKEKEENKKRKKKKQFVREKGKEREKNKKRKKKNNCSEIKSIFWRKYFLTKSRIKKPN